MNAPLSSKERVEVVCDLTDRFIVIECRDHDAKRETVALLKRVFAGHTDETKAVETDAYKPVEMKPLSPEQVEEGREALKRLANPRTVAPKTRADLEREVFNIVHRSGLQDDPKSDDE